MNALAQTTLKLTAPGNPDIYQGTELWDLSLVDPDNRRPVDYGIRRRLLKELSQSRSDLPALCREMLDHYRDGRIKMWVTMRILQLRNANPELFHHGSYVPLETSTGNRHLCAFARMRTDAAAQKSQTVIVAVPRFSYTLAGGRPLPPLADVWRNEAIRLPEGASPEFKNILTGESVSGVNGSLLCSELFRSFPVAVLSAH